jgi:glutamate dehydrogenase (NAD(P)+)
MSSTNLTWKVKAKVVVEAANIPIEHQIKEMLYSKHVLVVPDVIANSGGVISSYAEYLGKTPKDMFELVERKIGHVALNILKQSEKEECCPREVALEIAKQRVKRGKSSR